jgi:hypothetical protein
MRVKVMLCTLIGLGVLMLVGASSSAAGLRGRTSATALRPPAARRAALALPTPGQPFPQTGKTISPLFQAYWSQHGGVAQQGYPISNGFVEVSDLNGKRYTVQYFERAVFEYHPENAAPNDVLLSQLGTFQYHQKYPNGAPGQQPSTERPHLFAQTGKTLGGRFRDYWEQHGGLAQQGYPISDPFTEISDLNGKPYLVQYFERAVFEYHPENAAPNDVLLSLLGTFRLRAKYPTGAPGETTTGAAVDLKGRCLLGGVNRGQWTAPHDMAALLKGGETYRLYSLTGLLGQAHGGKPQAADPPFEDVEQVEIAPAPQAATLALGGTWDAQPRVPRVESTSQEVYRQAAAAILQAHGIAQPHVQLTQVLRVDLEGDGEPEVLVTATYHPDGVTAHAQAGEYSLVFLRKVIAGQVQTVILADEYFTQTAEFAAPLTFSVTGVLDLNGDGLLEVILYSEYYEGESTEVYAIEGLHVEDVLDCGFGV